MSDRVVVLWSGGVESTSILKYLLENSEDHISAIHISIPNIQKKTHLELGAISRLTPLLTQIRSFDYLCMKLDLPWPVGDPDMHAGLIPSILRSTYSTKFYRGHCFEDRIDDVLVIRDKIRKSVWTWLKQDLPKEYTNELNVSPNHLTHDWPKKKHIEHLGPLFKHTWSCWWPVLDKPCDKCTPCLHIASALK